MGEELFPYLKHSYVAFQEIHPALGLCKVLYIESEDDLVFRIAFGRGLHRKISLNE
jgi:hypothetical protein